MKKAIIFPVLLFNLWAASLIDSYAQSSTTLLQPPPLIDREIFFGHSEISGLDLSPDGQLMAFYKPYKGTRNIWVKKPEESFEKGKLITDFASRPVNNYFWSRDGKYILFIKDSNGDENFNVYAVDPREVPAEGASVPLARNITSAQNIRAQIYALPESDPDMIYVGLNDRDPAWHDIYKIRLSTGERTLVRKNTDRLQSLIFDNAGNARLALRSPPNGDTEIWSLDGERPTKVYSCNVFESCRPLRFNKDNTQVYLNTNKGSDLSRLVLFDPRSQTEKLIESDPLHRTDFGSASFSGVSGEIAATVYEDDQPRIYWRDKLAESDYKFLQHKFPGNTLFFFSSTRDRRFSLVSASSDTEPGVVVLFDRRTKKITTQLRGNEKLPLTALARMQTIHYRSSDGLEISAYLTLPKGVPARNLPLVVAPHGGPWERRTFGYDPFTQFLANRGYAVLDPNFRGSSGSGKKFLNAGNREWGGKMQDDVTWGVKYLVARGIADPKRIGILGTSYGGYSALAGLAFTPDLYAAGIAIAAPSNLISLLAAIPPYWEGDRMLQYTRIGDPQTPAGKALLLKQSPLYAAGKIKTPLMIVQGANDPRVPKKEADQIVAALRERSYPVEYLVAPDEGHVFLRPLNNLAMVTAIERFLAKHLGGRSQESISPEIQKRLVEITVDPKTVVIDK